jgi:hypothetical protein
VRGVLGMLNFFDREFSLAEAPSSPSWPPMRLAIERDGRGSLGTGGYREA